MSVVVVPPICGRAYTFEYYNGGKWETRSTKCDERGPCIHCRPLGQSLQDIGLAIGEYGHGWASMVTWNLTLAALMGAAASQAIERERFRSGVAANYNLAAFGGPCP